ncbi:glycerophosphodiester phosphodiesterase family protein [Corynebacterium nasicanis]|uniref:Glycerophosphodiester phosphodiesterase family protein n=1 Tax=Corynebacterium nasicanis TaxID=1448267 RepID=A0ABW1QDD5_9CORY
MEIIAHRGYSAKYPELTELAFARALELPIHGVECDVRLSRGGDMVVLHDPIIDRVADGRGRVSRMTLSDLREHNFGTEEHPQNVLTLHELLDMIAPTDKHLYIETKHPSRFGPMVEEQVVRTLQHAGMLDDPRIHVITFSAAAVVRMKRLAPQVDRFHLRRKYERWANPIDAHPGKPTGLGLSLQRARRRPDLIGKHGLPTYMWTVNEPADMLWARDNGVDLMATDEVSLALEVLGSS